LQGRPRWKTCTGIKRVKADVNIEQKNTLFVISLVLTVLIAVSVASFLLVRDHVATTIEGDLERANSVFIEAQKNHFDNLLTLSPV
jgi:hypothetical protein